MTQWRGEDRQCSPHNDSAAASAVSRSTLSAAPASRSPANCSPAIYSTASKPHSCHRRQGIQRMSRNLSRIFRISIIFVLFFFPLVFTALSEFNWYDIHPISKTRQHLPSRGFQKKWIQILWISCKYCYVPSRILCSCVWTHSHCCCLPFHLPAVIVHLLMCRVYFECILCAVLDIWCAVLHICCAVFHEYLMSRFSNLGCHILSVFKVPSLISNELFSNLFNVRDFKRALLDRATILFFK